VVLAKLSVRDSWAEIARLVASPESPTCQAPALEEWARPGVRVYVYDATSLRLVAREVFGNATWWGVYEAWAQTPSSFPSWRSDPESPGAFIHAELRHALEARSSEIEVVDSPEDATLVVWNIWDVALCAASGHQGKTWELSKGRLSQPCDAHVALLAWLQSTPRWRRNHGRDHVLYVDSPYSWESYLAYQPEWKRMQSGQLHQDAHPQEIQGITRNATMIGIEDRRAANHRGTSAFVAVPYFAQSSKYQAPAQRSRSHLVGVAASTVLNNWSACELCAQMQYDPTELRVRMFNDLKTGCAAGECEAYDLTELIGDSQRNNMSFYSSAGVNLDGVVHNAVFCPIPRGDSGCTKRFFAAILGGCIPVLVSDALVLPFASTVDYRKAMLRIPEAQFMSPGFSMLDFLRAQTPRQIAAMQHNLECIKSSITYRPRCPPSAGLQACSESSPAGPGAMDFLVASLVRFAHHPRESFGVTVAELYGSDTAVVASPLL